MSGQTLGSHSLAGHPPRWGQSCTPQGGQHPGPTHQMPVGPPVITTIERIPTNSRNGAQKFPGFSTSHQEDFSKSQVVGSSYPLAKFKFLDWMP